MVVVAPNSVVLLDSVLKKYDKKQARAALAQLKYRKLVEVKLVNGQYQYRLTNAGHVSFRKIQLEELSIPTPHRWDHLWRIVAFDIPATNQRSRRHLIYHLKQLGFYKLQHSLWVHPFECKEQVGVLVEVFGLADNVTLITASEGNFVDHATRHFIEQDLLM